MRVGMLRLLGIAFIPLTFIACSPAEQCAAGETRVCYTGPNGSDGVGACHRGYNLCGDDHIWQTACVGEVTPVAETCNFVDDNCDGDTDEGLANVCKGCGMLPTDITLGEFCGDKRDCSVWTCDGKEAIVCALPPSLSTRSCFANGCPGRATCENNVESCDAPVKNECGLCGGPKIDDIGGNCLTVPDMCPGAKECSAMGDGVVCVGPKAICDSCDVEVDLTDKPCIADNGCAGTWQCDEDLPGEFVCVTTLEKNQCGACVPPSGLAMGGMIGDTCDTTTTLPNGAGSKVCHGWKICDPSGTRLICDAPKANGCGLCGGFPIATTPVDKTPGKTCTANSCGGTWKCTADLTDTVCLNGDNETPIKNNCNVCNKPTVTEKGDTCTTADGCTSEKICNATGDGAICDATMKKIGCGDTCSKTALPGAPGSDCTNHATNTSKCPGTWQCKPDNLGVVCLNPAGLTPFKNPSCNNMCNVDTPPGFGAPCDDPTSNFCPGTMACRSNGATPAQPELYCVASPKFNGCACSSLVISLGATCTDNGCQSTTTCATNPSGEPTGATVCRPAYHNACGGCTELVGLDGPAEKNAPCRNGPCTGTMQCVAPANTQVKCSTSGPNDCGVCESNAALVGNLNKPCTPSGSPLPTGCTSTTTCNATGTGVVCNQLTGIGEPCQVYSTDGTHSCDGTQQCVAFPGSGTKCDGPTPNNCGACDGSGPVIGIGASCLEETFCGGTRACAPDKKSSICIPIPQNECGACGSAISIPATDLGEPCVINNTCTGQWQCLSDNMDAACRNSDCVSSDVVISEISFQSVNATAVSDSFVELYNPTAATLDIGGYTLWYRPLAAPSTWVSLATIDAQTTLEANRFYLFAHTSLYTKTPQPNRTYSYTIPPTAAGTIALTKNGVAPAMALGDPNVVDLVGFGVGTGLLFQGAAFPTLPAKGQSIERKAYPDSTPVQMESGTHSTYGNSQFSRNNSLDFNLRSARQPQNASSTPEVP